MPIEMEPIGIVHTPFASREGMPIQPRAGRGIKGTVEVFEAYAAGLADLEGFSHIILLVHLHRGAGYDLRVTPFLDTVKRGLFATRAPRRPNPIGLSVVKLLGLIDGVLRIENVDLLDGTPLLDIKPYVPAFDEADDIRIGWLEDKSQRVVDKRSDGRFT